VGELHAGEHERLVKEIVRLVNSGETFDNDYFLARIQGRREDILEAIQSAVQVGNDCLRWRPQRRLSTIARLCLYRRVCA
jgi:hypothetical protein